ncbi:hypothetical protein TRFO_02958 [Tritrichomonas foetus]|uniref:RRM domain-containing protein n=1 Tax=Tritrichomonas foetus TaxID=1144522 RepID=A0A1J4KTX3_9EUKA|nr:hypothetical protein TRFO_02958 [Tritrichomonas foetus]|eukprot:OHT14711.1 hypothetical protein TRFO_02958 [Tritrichomonas foetus]
MQLNFSAAVVKSEHFHVFVCNLPLITDESTLLNFFKKYIPAVERAQIIRTAEGMSKGCAYVAFKTEEDKLLAIKTLNNSFEFGSPIKVVDIDFESLNILRSIQIPSSTHHNNVFSQNNYLLVENFDPSKVNVNLIVRYFSAFGEVFKAKLYKKYYDKCVVSMKDENQARTVITALNGFKFGGSTKVQICLFDRNHISGQENHSTNKYLSLLDVKGEDKNEMEMEIDPPKIRMQKHDNIFYKNYFDKPKIDQIIEIMKNYHKLSLPIPEQNVDYKKANSNYSRKYVRNFMYYAWNSYVDLNLNENFG